MGKVRHGIGLRPGARVLGVIGMLIGLDDVDDWELSSSELGVEVRMYRSLPGGTMDRCNVCCTGGGADASGNAARNDAMETLLNLVSPDGENADSIDSNVEEDRLQQVIEEVGRVVLKHHPDSQTETEFTDEGMPKKRQSIDIWVVRARADPPASQGIQADTQGKTFVSSHRFLGRAMMETKYARRVALDQLSEAARCLVLDNAKRFYFL